MLLCSYKLMVHPLSRMLEGNKLTFKTTPGSQQHSQALYSEVQAKASSAKEKKVSAT